MVATKSPRDSEGVVGRLNLGYPPVGRSLWRPVELRGNVVRVRDLARTPVRRPRGDAGLGRLLDASTRRGLQRTVPGLSIGDELAISQRIQQLACRPQDRLVSS